MKEKAYVPDFDDTLELREPTGRGEKAGKRRSLMTEEENRNKDKVMAAQFCLLQTICKAC